MNLFNMDVSKKCLIGECWVPMADLAVVQNCLSEGSVQLQKYLNYYDSRKLGAIFKLIVLETVRQFNSFLPKRHPHR